MAKKKSRTSQVSSGNTKKINMAREAKRQAKFAAKRENGTAYTYKKNPYEEGTHEWLVEDEARRNKAKSPKLPLARLTSIMRKLDNEIERQKIEAVRNKKKRIAAAE